MEGRGYILMGMPLSSQTLCVIIDKTTFTTIMYHFVQMHWISWAKRQRESRYLSRYRGIRVSRYPGTEIPR